MQTRTILVLVVSLTLLLPVSVTGIASYDPGFQTSEMDYSREYLLVQLRDPALASYAGGIQGLARTMPSPGARLDLDSRAAQAYFQHLANQHDLLKAYLADRAPRAQVIREYSVVFNGVALKLNGELPDTVIRGPGVRNLAFSRLFSPMMNISPALVGAPTLWARVGGSSEAGLGVKIGIIDTGIDNTHPFLTDPSLPVPEGFPKCDARNAPVCSQLTSNKVIVAKVYQTLTNHNASDQRSHGTHVSGTAAGVTGVYSTAAPITDVMSGIAPKAYLGNYNVFPGTGIFPLGGSSFEHDIIHAVEDSVVDGMDVINMSLGGSPRFLDLLSIAVNAAVDAGVVAAIAAGNDGPGQETISSPGVAEKAITAGASTNPHFIGISVTVGSQTFGAALGDFNNFEVATAEYTVTEPANGCSAITTSLSGKIALIDRGVCTFTTKIRNAQTAGAIGVLVVNSVAGDPVAMGHDDTDPFPTVPAAMLSRTDGNSIKPSGMAMVDGTSPMEFVTTNADIIAGFSSRGPSFVRNALKPDVTAPGVNVYSSVQCQDDFCGFAMFQGTSMATPHVAGSAAVLRQLHPDWSPDQVKSALVDTGKRPVLDHVRATSSLGAIHRGGGRIDLAAAAGVEATLSPVHVSYGSLPTHAAWTRRTTFAVTSVSAIPVTYSVSVIPIRTHATVTFGLSTDRLSLSPGGSDMFTFSISTSRSTPVGDYEGDIVLTSSSGTLRIPFWIRISPPSPIPGRAA